MNGNANMASASVSEAERAAAISTYQLGEGGTDAEFDSVARLATEMFDVPIALVTVLRTERQVFQGACGLEGDGTERSAAFCNHTVEQRSVFVVEDAEVDPLFAANPLVLGPPYVRFYAGAPILVGQGVPIGALCLIDRLARTFSDQDRKRLLMLADIVTRMMELRLGSRMAEERKLEMERQAQLLRLTVDSVRQGIAVFDPELRLELWNERLFDLLPLTPAQRRVGTPASEMLMSAAVAGVLGPGDADRLVQGALENLGSQASSQRDITMPDGRIAEIWRATIPSGRTILTARDVTVERSAARMKDEFVSTASHELRTPLTSIIGALAVMDRSAEGLDARGRQMLTMAQKNAERLKVLVNDILDMEKLGAGRVTLVKTRVDLNELVAEAMAEARPFDQIHKVDLQLEAPSSSLVALVDRGRIHQAITNLISNACKFSPPGSSVELTLERSQAQAIIAVADHGPGIPLEFRPHIFQRFAQADAEHQGGRGGSGLGLAITRELVTAHGGQVGFESETGVGSRFWIALPLQDNAL